MAKQSSRVKVSDAQMKRLFDGCHDKKSFQWQLARELGISESMISVYRKQYEKSVLSRSIALILRTI
jgi:hypothetical protein